MINTVEHSMSRAAVEPARRLEIFTGAGRRRRWPPDAKARIVAESFSGTATVSEIARRYGLCGAQLFAWRRQARAERSAAGRDAGSSFVPVEISSPEAGQACLPAPGSVSITVAGAVLHIPAGLEPAAITALIRAIRAAS